MHNYIVYNNFVNIAKNTFENKLNKLEDFIFSTKCLTRCLIIKLIEYNLKSQLQNI